MTKSRGLQIRRGTRTIWAKEQQGKHVCACGCGTVIDVKPVHYTVGLPRFIHGHNTVVTHAKPPVVNDPCACGCGGIPRTAGRRYCHGHASKGRDYSEETRSKLSLAKRGALNPAFGKQSPNYIGRFVTTQGYARVVRPEHPFRDSASNSVMEHRAALEEFMREHDPDSPHLTSVDGALYLRPEVDVHHLNGARDDNRPENLVAMTKSEHGRHHREAQRM
jgi:hypothetical protein